MTVLAATYPEVWGLGALQWSVVGVLSTAGALLIAALAAFIAMRQYRLGAATSREQAVDAERTRKEHAEQAEAARVDQARPYVLLTIDTGETSLHMLDVVLSNVGAGPARDVQITVTPPLERARPRPYPLSEARVFTEPIEMLPPGFQQRMWFDSAIHRQAADPPMPGRHKVNIKYHDGHGHQWDEDSVLDVDLMNGVLFNEAYGIHHAAEALREISKVLKNSKTLAGGFEVVVEHRERRRERVAQERAEWEASVRSLEQQQAQLAPRPVDAADDIEA
jgi:hypothetical protein